MRNQFNKHFRETEILNGLVDTALVAVEDILEKLHNISNETFALVDEISYNNFYSRYV